MKRTGKLVAAGVTSLALFGGIGAGIAYADPTPAPSSTTTAAPSEKRPRAKARDRVQHGELFFQRGTVEKVAGDSITIKSPDDYVGTYVIGEKIRVVVGAKGERKPGTVADVKAGDRVRLLAVKDGDTLTAKRIVDRGPK